ncbi:hypothetical protein ACIBSW_16750 [Actinoplanes sp. NPDC049668]|uniref:hypothetical protein n=1 Tax=unclassified Actinoplanes TaxID=2626549 RepID=UPI0033AC8859
MNEEDLATVRRAINHWNGVYGVQFGTAIVPISWSEHAAAEFGQTAQGAINQQIVDSCDGCIAIFANRLGTPTESAVSGTAEEIQRLADSGKYVAILRCTRSVNTRNLDLLQLQGLNQYLGDISAKSLTLSYDTNEQLSRHVDNILAQAVSRDSARAELQLGNGKAVSARTAEVWPRLDSSERVRTDSRGRVSTSRDWRIVLHNTGEAPARNVRFDVDTDSWHVISSAADADAPDVEILAPGGEAKFIFAASLGSAPQALCTVTWEDDRGPQKNSATLRLA